MSTEYEDEKSDTKQMPEVHFLGVFKKLKCFSPNHWTKKDVVAIVRMAVSSFFISNALDEIECDAFSFFSLEVLRMNGIVLTISIAPKLNWNYLDRKWLSESWIGTLKRFHFKHSHGRRPNKEETFDNSNNWRERARFWQTGGERRGCAYNTRI